MKSTVGGTASSRKQARASANVARHRIRAASATSAPALHNDDDVDDDLEMMRSPEEELAPSVAVKKPRRSAVTGVTATASADDDGEDEDASASTREAVSWVAR
ncbi:hypothetical protein EBZ39_18760 [bacterium]|nr:hypothetical protein [bacterium]